MKRLLLIALLYIFSVSANAERLAALLTGYEEVPAVSTAATGEFRGTIIQNGNTINYELTYSGLTSVSQAHIHFAQQGVNGGVVVWLCATEAIPGPSGTPTCPANGLSVSGTITATKVVASATFGQQLSAGELSELIAAIRAGVTYVNVHTEASSAGELRGQITSYGR